MTIWEFKLFWMFTILCGSLAGYVLGRAHAQRNIERIEAKQLFARRIREVMEMETQRN